MMGSPRSQMEEYFHLPSRAARIPDGDCDRLSNVGTFGEKLVGIGTGSMTNVRYDLHCIRPRDRRFASWLRPGRLSFPALVAF